MALSGGMHGKVTEVLRAAMVFTLALIASLGINECSCSLCHLVTENMALFDQRIAQLCST
jgi:hypothetical protein